MIWIAGGAKGLWQQEAGRWRQVPAPPCPQRQVCAEKQVICACAGGEVWDPLRQSQLCACPGVERMVLSPCGRYVYLLSGEADSVLCCRVRDGRLLYANRAGVWPQDLRLDKEGRHLVVAGGAAGEALVFTAPELRLLHRYALPGAACQALFKGRKLVALLAVEEGQIRTALGETGEQGYREWGRWPGLPGMLCEGPGDQLILGSLDQLACFDWKQRAWRWRQFRQGLPVQGQLHPRGLLLTDSLEGCVSLWRGKDQVLFCSENVFAMHNEGGNGLY